MNLSFFLFPCEVNRNNLNNAESSPSIYLPTGVGRPILLNPFLFKGEHESNNSAARQGWPGSLYRAPFLVHAFQDKALRPAKLILAGSLT